MLDFRVVIAACVAGIVILFGGIGLLASFKIAHEPVRPEARIVERPRVAPNASLPVVIETPALKPAPAREAVRTPEPAPVPVAAPTPAPVAPPAAIETTGTITPRSTPVNPARAIRAPAFPAALAPAVTGPVENPAATADLPASKSAAKKGPRRPRAAPRPAEPQNPFSAIFGGLNQ
jgi:hypothetical protein